MGSIERKLGSMGLAGVPAAYGENNCNIEPGCTIATDGASVFGKFTSWVSDRDYDVVTTPVLVALLNERYKRKSFCFYINANGDIDRAEMPLSDLVKLVTTGIELGICNP